MRVAPQSEQAHATLPRSQRSSTSLKYSMKTILNIKLWEFAEELNDWDSRARDFFKDKRMKMTLYQELLLCQAPQEGSWFATWSPTPGRVTGNCQMQQAPTMDWVNSWIHLSQHVLLCFHCCPTVNPGQLLWHCTTVKEQKVQRNVRGCPRAVEPDFKKSNKKSDAQGACRRLYPTFAQ